MSQTSPIKGDIILNNDSIFDNKTSIHEHSKFIYLLKEDNISLKHQNEILKLENEKLKSNIQETARTIKNDPNKENKPNVSFFDFNYSIFLKNKKTEINRLREQIKDLQAKLFKLETENKGLYECLSKTDILSEISLLKKCDEFSQIFKENQEVFKEIK